MNIFENMDPNAQQGQQMQPGQMPQQNPQQQQMSPAQQKLAGMIAQKQKETAGLKAQQIQMKQKDLDKEKAQALAQAKSQQNKPGQTQGVGGANMPQPPAMKNEGITQKQAKLIDVYMKTLKMAEKTLAEEENMSQRQIQPEQYQNNPDEMGETDDISAIKNKTILKHLGHEVGKDDQIHRAERIISKFEKIIPKLKMAIQTIRQRLMQNEYGHETGLNMQDREHSELADKERKRQLVAAMRNK